MLVLLQTAIAVTLFLYIFYIHKGMTYNKMVNFCTLFASGLLLANFTTN
jgi:hypothetical protein